MYQGVPRGTFSLSVSLCCKHGFRAQAFGFLRPTRSPSLNQPNRPKPTEVQDLGNESIRLEDPKALTSEAPRIEHHPSLAELGNSIGRCPTAERSHLGLSLPNNLLSCLISLATLNPKP